MPEPKDAIIAILGASGTLAGLLLVFSGYIAEAASEANRSYARAAEIALYPFWGFLVTTLTSLGWLVFPQYHFLYLATTVLFCLLVVGTGISMRIGIRIMKQTRQARRAGSRGARTNRRSISEEKSDLE